MKPPNGGDAVVEFMPEPLRTDEEVRQILRNYFPKLADETVEVVSLLRIPGRRFLLVVRSNDPAVSAVAAVSPVRGERLNALSAELGHECLTALLWDPSTERLIRSAFAADTVTIDAAAQRATVVLHPVKLRPRPADDNVCCKDIDMVAQEIRTSSEIAQLLSRFTGWTIQLAS
jgi:hypothetical protein